MDHDRDPKAPASVSRRAQDLPRQALRRPHAGAFGLGRRCARAAVHRSPACRHPPPFRPAARDGRSIEIVGRAQRAVARPRRKAPRRPCRGPPHRVRRLRGAHSRGQLRRGRRDRVGPRRVGANRRSGGRIRKGKTALRAARLQAARRVDAREDQEVGEGLAPDQGADAYTSKNGATFPPGSVLSGLTVEELRDGNKKAAKLVAELKRLKAPERAVRAEDVAPMLAETGEEPYSRSGWVFEVKLDGYRMRAVKEDGTARLITRNGNDYSAAFPELIRPLAALPN